jgi:hypothetical protein
MKLNRRKFVLLSVASIAATITNASANVATEAVKAATKAKDIGTGVKAALLGLAGASVFLGWYFTSRKVADARQVNATYEKMLAGKTNAKGGVKSKRRTKGLKSVPKNEIVPAFFASKISASKPSKKKKEIQITTTSDLIGYGDKVPAVSQKYALYDEQNKLVGEHIESLKIVDSAGTYETESKFTPPSESANKTFTVVTSLLVDSKAFDENRYKISFERDTAPIVA